VGSKARIVSVSERQRPEKSEVGLLLCDASKASRVLKWAPQISLEEGLGRTADYLRHNLGHYRSDRYVV
jgi:nucleoside-diphosphate-sugar epimerase